MNCNVVIETLMGNSFPVRERMVVGFTTTYTISAYHH